ncbi:MAG: amidase [Candidatus Sericytochromatia bacterium]|nr:amidase [Candidatus Tanganyikabacteria bacterium]
MPDLTATRDLNTLSATDLAGALRAGEVSAREAVEAHIRRVEEVNPKLNAVIFTLFDEALREAAAADARRLAGEALGPLHGVPITVKECQGLAGSPWTIGLTNRKGQACAEDGVHVARLRAAGAIVLGKGNIPQFMMSSECDNPVYGRTNNPWDLGRAPGGSSGGDAAIVAAGGAAFGLGGDIGGSLRNPAHVCGISTLKPTSRRLASIGAFDPNDRQEAMPAQSGPLARSVADLARVMDVLAAPGLEDVDFSVPPVPWRDPAAVDVSKLRIGFYEEDSFYPASPAIRRAVREAAAALRARGAEVEPWQPPHVERFLHFWLMFIGGDGGEGLLEAAAGSTLDYRMERMLKIARLNPLLRGYFRWKATRSGQRVIMPYLDIREISLCAYNRILEERRGLVREVMADWRQRRFDAILCPPAPLAALTHGSTADLGPSHAGAAYYNVLGVPAGVVAATRVRPGEESDRPETRDICLAAARKVEQGSAGLPVGVHVAARHWREDIVLAVMGALEEHFRAQPDYPLRPPI